MTQQQLEQCRNGCCNFVDGQAVTSQEFSEAIARHPGNYAGCTVGHRNAILKTTIACRRVDASAEEIAKVHEVLKRSSPLMIEGIEEATGFPNYIIHSAIRALKAQGVNVQGRYLNEYDPDTANQP